MLQFPRGNHFPRFLQPSPSLDTISVPCVGQVPVPSGSGRDPGARQLVLRFFLLFIQRVLCHAIEQISYGRQVCSEKWKMGRWLQLGGTLIHKDRSVADGCVLPSPANSHQLLA